MIVVYVLLGIAALYVGGSYAVRAHVDGRANIATAYAAVALFGVGLIVAPLLMKRSHASAQTTVAAPVVEAAPVDWFDTAEAKNQAINQGMQGVRFLLKDPSSAQFQYVYTKKSLQGFLVSCGVVNAKNSFGGYSGPQRFLSIIDSAMIDTDGSYVFENNWRSYCG